MAQDAKSPYLLVLDAAEGLLQFLVARREPEETHTLLCAESWHAPSQGAELLAPALAQAFERLKILPRDIGRIASVRGPGSFTGLRLALATAAGLARSAGALQAGIDYMPLLAANALAGAGSLLETSASVWVLTHARRQLVHMQGFAAFPSLRVLTGIRVCSPEEAVGLMHAAGKNFGTSLVLGSGLTRNREALENAFAASGGNPVFLPPLYDHPCAQSLLRSALGLSYGGHDIAPLYARPSDAEENLDSIAASLGLDPARAREKLSRLTGNSGT